MRIDRVNLLPIGASSRQNQDIPETTVYRDLGPKDGVLDRGSHSRPPGYSLIWNPARFERKALLDLANGFTKARPIYKEIDAIQLSECYLAMLTWVMAQEVSNSLSSARQFAVIMSTGHGAARTPPRCPSL